MTKSKILTLAMTVLFSLTMNTPAYSASSTSATSGLTISYDGKTETIHQPFIRLFVGNSEVKNLKMPPILLNGQLYVPAQEAFEGLGVILDWKADPKELYLAYQNNLLMMEANSTIGVLNGELIDSGYPMKIVNGKQMVPCNFVAQSLGLVAEYNAEAKQIRLSSLSINTNPTPPPELSHQTPVPTSPWRPAVQPTSPGLSTNPLPTPWPTVSPTPLPANPTANNTNTTPSESNNTPTLPQSALDQKPSSVTGITNQLPAPEGGGYFITDNSTQVIQDEKRLETTITDIYGPSNIYEQVYMINSNSPMTGISYFVHQNSRLVIDIKNAQFGLSKTEYLMNSPVVAKIRASQFEVEPVKVTRVVFDIQNSTSFTVSLSEDRQTLHVNFGKVNENLISSIDFKSVGETDFVYIHCSNDFAGNISALTNPDRVVLDLKLSTLKNDINKNVVGKYMTAYHAAMLDEHTVRVVLDLNKLADFELIKGPGLATIKLTAPTYKSMWYDTAKKTIRLQKVDGLSAANILHTDNYLSRSYILTLPGDFSSLLGFGSLQMNDTYLTDMKVRNNAAGKTELVINQKQILAYIISEDENYIYIRAVLPKEKYSKIVIIDPGHGGASAPGTSGNGLVEKNINLDVGLRLMKILEADASIKAYATRLSDSYPGFGDRVEMANMGDIFISLHCNSGDKNTSVSGIETFYYPHDNDAALGFTTAAFAGVLQKQLIKDLGVIDRKAKKGDLYVVRYPVVPAILIEMGFITNAAEAKKLADPNYQQQVAQSVYQGILQTFLVYKPKR